MKARPRPSLYPLLIPRLDKPQGPKAERGNGGNREGLQSIAANMAHRVEVRVMAQKAETANSLHGC